MKLKSLISKCKGVQLKGKDVDITGISADSRTTVFGNLFIARKGSCHHGSEFIQDAIEAGARAVVTDLYDPFLKISQVISKDPQKLEALLSSIFYKTPSKRLFVTGVTGTKGKTTTCHLLFHLFKTLEGPTGLVTTNETNILGVRPNFETTTRDAISNQKILKEMVDQKCTSAVLEVSSHGLVQGRVDEIFFDVGVFTNLSVDHLDYHKTMEQYALAKGKLFSLCQASVFNADSPWIRFLKPSQKHVSFGIQNQADIQASQIQLEKDFSLFEVSGVEFKVPLFGLFNIYNILGAISVGVLRGFSLEEMAQALKSFPGVEGRLQKVQNAAGVDVYVDYAHSGESLKEVLSELKKVSKGKIFVVFGSGGNRDPMRRKLMAKAAEEGADFSIITSDNPRKEDPDKICKEILEGFNSSENVLVERDRQKAIFKALSLSKKGDTVLITGKGHEKVQIFSNQTVTFDDVALCEKFFQK